MSSPCEGAVQIVWRSLLAIKALWDQRTSVLGGQLLAWHGGAQLVSTILSRSDPNPR